jgi:pimeloyl-ACP methyl ester carboxylesterase
VYLSAGVPDVGEGVGSGPTTRTAPVFSGFTLGDDGTVTVEPTHAVQLFYPDADPAVASEWSTRLRPGQTFTNQAVPRAAWRTRPVDYVVCRDDAVLPADAQRWYAERAGATVHELPGDHSPFLARPTALAELLVQIVAVRAGSVPERRAGSRHASDAGHD